MSRNERLEIISKSHRFQYDTILISVLPQDQWKISIALKRQVRGACNRNTIKRIIRESYRTSKFFLEQPVAMVFTVLKQPERLRFADFQQFLVNCIRGVL